MRTRPHRLLLATAAALLVLAFVLRIGEVQRTSYSPIGDARSYLSLGSQITQFGDYAPYDQGAGGSAGPTAYFPPAYPYLLAAVDLLDEHSPTSGAAIHADRLVSAGLGTVIVGLIGLIALELFGGAGALIALALAAVYPPLIALSGVLVAENLFVAFELGAVWAVLRSRSGADPARWLIGAGICTGLAALSHVNGLLLLLPLALAARGARPVLGRRQVTGPGVVIIATLLTLMPWLIRDGVVMHRFVPITDEAGITLAGTYNPTSAHATDPAFKWVYYRTVRADRGIARHAGGMTEPQLSSTLTSRSLSYIADHPLSPLEAGWDNTLRLLELDGSHAWRASAASIGINSGTADTGVIGFWVLLGLALMGTLSPLTRRVPRWVWVVPLLMALSALLVNAETPRFREAVDPFLILAAAAALGSLLVPLTERARDRYLNWRYVSRL